MSRSQRTPAQTPTSTGNKEMSNNNAALLGALMAFGGANKSNGDMIRSRGNSPSTPGSSVRGRPTTGVSPSPSYRSSAGPAANRVSPAVSVRTNATATANQESNSKPRANTPRPAPPPLKPKPRRLSETHFKPQPISPATSFVGVLENNTLRSPKQKPYPNALRKPVESMDLHAQAKAAPHEGKGQEERQDTARHQASRVSSQDRAGTGYNASETQDRAAAPVQVKVEEQASQGGPGRVKEKEPDLPGVDVLSSDDDSSSQEYVSASEDTAPSPTGLRKSRSPPSMKQPPTPPPARSRQPPAARSGSHGPTKPIDIARPPRKSMSSTRSLSSHSNPSLNATYNSLYPRRTTRLTLGEDLANAMVASSLATSRASSPTKLAPPSLGSHRHNHLSHFHSRTPSPAKKTKGMRQTLRDPESSSSESETGQHPYGKHKKKRHLRPKHPNKHHEGDRKRWRDAVTERERKRYEGLFASNRGLLLPPSLPYNVSNFVVRDLWSRSRLPQSELETIWNLVAASSPVTYLSKEEFVVGLWLIDQRLKGRKLPVKVSETVWASVRGLQGIKIKKFVG